MWTKEYYQETVLDYLGFVQTEIEVAERSRVKRRDIAELYDDLDATLERLWRIIRASDANWEEFRFPLEASCDELISVLTRLQSRAGNRQTPHGRFTH